MNANMVLGIVNVMCLIIIAIVLVFLFVELNRFKRMEEEILYYLNKSSAPKVV